MITHRRPPPAPPTATARSRRVVPPPPPGRPAARDEGDRQVLRPSLIAVPLVLSALALPPTAAAQLSVGSPGLGDEYFPLAGNGGYDVGHYVLRLDYDPATDVPRRPRHRPRHRDPVAQ